MKKELLITLLYILVFSAWASAQNIIKGQVKSTDGHAINAATIIIRGTRAFAIADAEGQFALEPKTAAPWIIRISAIGHKTEDIRLETVPPTPLTITLTNDLSLGEVLITSRRRSEVLQSVPIPISVVGNKEIQETGSFNVNRIKELVPSVQLYSSNPRNTGINIRGIGSPFGLTNDGLDPGVGYYVDGVYYARPAAATLDFIDIEQVEVLRGPQGTLFGKNTTAGAFNITSRRASFTPSADFEVSYGNYGYIQAKASITGALTDKLAARVSFAGTQRDGVIQNIATNRATNDINNIGWRAQLLYKLSDKTIVTLTGDNTIQKPDGYAQVIAGIAPTQRPAYRQFYQIISDLGYTLPTINPFERKIDHDTPWKSDNDLGGASLNIESKIGLGTLTSTTAWRYWNWGPSNDRDFTGLQSLALSQNPSKHRNWSQEIRYAGDISDKLSGIIGLFYINQTVRTNGSEVAGNAQWRFSQNSTSPLWQTPGLFEGYGVFTTSSIASQSAAIFANADWEIAPGFHIQPGLRFNYDNKDVNYNRQAKGGVDFDPNHPDYDALIALRRGVYSNQAYIAQADETNFTYHFTLSYRPHKNLNAYATYSTSFKPVGVNVAGLPTITVNGQTQADLSLSVIKPEYVTHYEAGVKTTPAKDLNVNITFFNTDIKDYQANVQSPQLGVNRGYIANADRVRVLGSELEITYKLSPHFNLGGAVTYTDGKYVKFTNAPLPLEETGAAVSFKDISGSRLPGISKWSGSVNAEYAVATKFLSQQGNFFISANTFFRSGFSSSPSPSAYLNVDGYALLNGRIGFRASQGVTVFVWGRNILNQDYFEQLLPAGGNAGHYAGVLGDPRTYGATLRYSF